MAVEMRQNKSKYPDSLLLPLEKFVFSRSRFGGTARLMIRDAKPSEWVSHGYAQYGWIVLDLADYAKYPKRDSHRASTGTVAYRSFAEEYLYLLAHEARHIDQHNSTQAVPFPEVDAECWAQTVLAAYRGRPYESIGELPPGWKRRYPAGLKWRP